MRVADPQEREVRAIRSLVDVTGMDVLEIGCGDGRLTWRYADDASSVRALDVNAGEIAAARAAMPRRLRGRVRFEVGDVTTAPLPESAYDLAILSYSL